MKKDNLDSFESLYSVMNSMGESKSVNLVDPIDNMFESVSYFSLPAGVIPDRPEFVMGRKSVDNEILIGVSKWWEGFSDFAAAGQYLNLKHTVSAQNPGVLVAELDWAKNLLSENDFSDYLKKKQIYLDNAVEFAEGILRSKSADYTLRDVSHLQESSEALWSYRNNLVDNSLIRKQYD